MTVACKKCGQPTTNAWEFCDTCPSLAGVAATVFRNDNEKQKIFLDQLEAEDVTIEQLLKWTPPVEDAWLAQQLGLTKGKRQALFELIDKWKGKTYLRR